MGLSHLPHCKRVVSKLQNVDAWAWLPATPTKTLAPGTSQAGRPILSQVSDCELGQGLQGMER